MIAARAYTFEDSLALSDSKVFRKLFMENMADFTPFDPGLNAGFATGWQAAINLAEQQKTDETISDQLQQHTTKVAAQDKICYEAANGVKYYIKKAFGVDETKWKEFGFHLVHRTRQTTDKFITWMKVLHNQAAKYKPELMAADMPEPEIDSLLPKANTLETANLEQETFKRERLALTQQRVLAYNALWEFAQTVSSAADNVYSEDEVKRGLFRLR